MISRKIACFATSALMGGLLVAGSAMAQSTGSQLNEVEGVIVTAAGQKAVAGIIAETLPKTRSSINEQFIATQTTGQTILQSLNLVPGMSFTNNDAYGSSGGNIRLRGFDGNRVSVTFDGIPLNDTGNYAVFPNQMLDGELISRASVNQGTTDVDSPTASATGGTINYTTRKPTKEMGAVFTAGIGESNFHRLFALANTGEFGPWGTTAWFAMSDQKYDKWKGYGQFEKKQYNARLYQDLGNGDFLSLAVHYNENRNNNIRQMTLPEYRAFGRDLDFTESCVTRTINAATATITTVAPTIPGNCADFYGRQVNPSNTGNIRGSGSFHLADNLRLTVDPSFQYVLADGGTQLATISETDGRLRGTSTAGRDLNGNGVISATESSAFFAPSVTNTRRYGLTSSLIWDLNDNHRVRAAYTVDFGKHRQTGEWAPLNSDGTTTNVFGGKDGEGTKIATADGSFIRGRDRASVAQLNQIAADYRGRFMDSKLVVNLGLRAPFFKRELNQFCYTQNASGITGVVSGFAVSCTTQVPNAAATDGSVTFGTSATKFIKPYSAEVEYEDILPNVGVSYELSETSTIYTSYAEGFSSPRTDSLYTATLRNGVGTPADVEPETTQTIDLGYRFSMPDVVASVAVWNTKFQNRIVQSFDQDLGISIDRNVGDVKAFGLDAQAAWRIEDYLTVSASFSYNNSELQQDLRTGSAATAILPLAGKKVVETPEYTWSSRVDWSITEKLKFGVQAKYTGDRFSTDVNDEVAPGYTRIDMDLRYDLPFAKRTYVQLNLDNVFDEDHFGSISSRTNAVTIVGVSNGSAPTYHVGAPRNLQLTLRTEF